MLEHNAIILANEPVATDIYKLRLAARDISRQVQPGQFVQLGLPALEAHILRRPFSVFATDKESGELEIIYQLVGEGTEHLSDIRRGWSLRLLGPLGSGWQVPPGCKRVLLVGGGVGVAPLYLLACELAASRQVTLLVGARSQEFLLPLPDLPQAVELLICSDDGSVGRAGLTTVLAAELLANNDAVDGGYDFVACCGPEPMQKGIAALAATQGLPCQLSLERRMACGLGACLGCVVDTVGGKRRVCLDGPVFDAREVIW